MHLDLSDEEAAALTRELHDIVENDHYPYSPRIRTLSEILAKLRPEAVRGVELRPSLDQTSTQALAVAEGVRAAASRARPKATARLG